jgi:hypothetical protein
LHLRTDQEPVLFTTKKIPFDRWRYHAVLEYDGIIYDLSQKKGRTALPVAEYFSTVMEPCMYQPRYGPEVKCNHSINHFSVYEMPAHDYLDRYPTRPIGDNYKVTHVFNFPRFFVKDYIGETR